MPVHTLGTAELSRLCPQARLVTGHQPRSGACGFVDNGSPQTVDESSAHRLLMKLSTGCPQGSGTCPQLLHTPVHCSATQRAISPGRVKGVTQRCQVGLWATWVKLGTTLGRSGPWLCIRCAELSAVHSSPGLSTGAVHRHGGQNLGPDLRKRGYPRFPQPLLLRPSRERAGIDLKWGLCTTRGASTSARPSRLDPDRHQLSVRCVRLVPGVLPTLGTGQPLRQRRQTSRASSQASAGGGLR